MRKWIIVLVVALAIAAAFFAWREWGGSSDRELAQEYLVRGDRSYSVAAVSGAKLRKQLEASSGSPGGLAANAESLKKEITRYKTMLTLSLLSYQHTNALYDIQDYLTYKNMMVKTIALDLDAADKLAPILESILKAPGDPDTSGTEQVDPILKKMASAQQLYRAASRFRDENNLMGQ